MKVYLIYSGWLRSYNKCKNNHSDVFVADEVCSVHVNEGNTDLEHYNHDDWVYNSNKAPETIVRNTLNQWRNMMLAFNLAPKSFDVYVRMRYDILIEGNINFSSIKPNTVYIPYGNDYRGGINDQFAYGDYDSIKKYYDVYNNYNDLYYGGCLFHTETLVKANIERTNLAVERISNKVEIVR